MSRGRASTGLGAPVDSASSRAWAPRPSGAQPLPRPLPSGSAAADACCSVLGHGQRFLRSISSRMLSSSSDPRAFHDLVQQGVCIPALFLTWICLRLQLADAALRASTSSSKPAAFFQAVFALLPGQVQRALVLGLLGIQRARPAGPAAAGRGFTRSLASSDCRSWISRSSSVTVIPK